MRLRYLLLSVVVLLVGVVAVEFVLTRGDTPPIRAPFDEDRIYLLGHSWGSRLGVLAVRERPELYRGFIGTGQMAAGPDRVEEIRFLTEPDRFHEALRNFHREAAAYWRDAGDSHVLD